MHVPYARTKFQWFMSDPPLSPFVSTPRLLHSLHTIRVAKAVPDGLTWQDQFNLHKKGLNPMDMRSLLQLLEAIEHICTQERSNAQSTEKASMKCEKGNNI